MKVGIIGGGVIGMTCGVVLAEAGHEVHIFSKDSFEATTSHAAGAICYPFGVEESERVIGWFLRSQEVFQNLKSIPEAGIFEARWRRLSVNSDVELPFWFSAASGGRRLVSGDPALIAPYRGGLAADFLIVGVDRYLPYLMDRFVSAGGVYKKKQIGNHQEIASDFDALVNATGIGARAFSRDAGVYPARGQAVVVKNPGIEWHTALAEKKFYLYPRGEQCLLGGSFDVNEWDLTPDDALTRDILAWAASIEPKLAKPEIIDVRVGLRPMRETVRLERKVLPCGTPFIHNYGHGDAGYALSWGCAETVHLILQE